MRPYAMYSQPLYVTGSLDRNVLKTAEVLRVVGNGWGLWGS